MKHYSLDDPQIGLVEVDVIAALDSMPSRKVQIEFPERLWDAPVVTGIGRRVQNPRFPKDSTQRYAFLGSPWDWRIPRMDGGVFTVKYMNQKFIVRAFERTHASQKKSTIFKAFDMENK